MSKENPGINCNLCLRCVNCAMLLANRGSRLKEMLRRRDNNFLLVEVYLLKQILTDNDASNMEKILRKKSIFEFRWSWIKDKDKISARILQRGSGILYVMVLYLYNDFTELSQICVELKSSLNRLLTYALSPIHLKLVPYPISKTMIRSLRKLFPCMHRLIIYNSHC